MSSEPTEQDFQNALNEHWHDRPPASLEDVMALYGVLAVAESGGGLFTNPGKLEPFVDDGRLVTISVDVTEETPEVIDTEYDVLREEDVPKLGYSHKSSGRGAKYSLTQIGSKNGNDAEGVASTIIRKVRSWTTKDSVQSVVEEEYRDAWLVEALADVFKRDSETLEGIKSDILSILPADESVPTVVTVRLRVNGEDLASVDTAGERWVWPADVSVLNEAKKRYASANAANKNIDRGASEGHGVGVVSGNKSRVVGTPESPLDVFSVKHPDAQPGVRREQSWRHYPVSPEVAMLFAKGQDLIEQCVYRRGGLETYALPYFAGQMTETKASALFFAIDSVREQSRYIEDGDPPMSQVTFHLREHDNPEVQDLANQELRFYTVTMPIGDDKHIISETPTAETYWVSELADALVTTVHRRTLDPTQGGFSESENWPLLDLPPKQRNARTVAFYRITGREFTDSVFAYRDDNEGDDFRRTVDHRLISGQSVDASMLLDEYLRRYADAADGNEPPPYQIVAQQLVHLETLSRAGLLTGIDTPIEYTDTTMTEDIDTTDVGAIRKHRFEAFLDRPLFDDPTRRAATVAGVLIGQVSWYQDSERGIGRPLDTGTQGDQLTANSLENALTTALEKSKVYAQEAEHERDVLFPETVDKLLEVTKDMPTSWDIGKRELQFTYVLGHAHGRRSMPAAFELYESEEADGNRDDAETESVRSNTTN